MKNLILIMCVVLMIGAVATKAESIVFTESGQILEGEVWDWVSIYNDDTIVDMEGGLADLISTYDESTLNVFGGHAELSLWDYSTTNIFGGDLSAVITHDNGTVNLSGDAEIDGVGIGEFGTINMSGGFVGNLLGRQSGILNIQEGTITNFLSVKDTSMANIFGYDLFKSSTGGSYGYGYISGFWADDSAFLIDLNDPETYSHINLVPEPCTLCLVGLGALLLRKRT